MRPCTSPASHRLLLFTSRQTNALVIRPSITVLVTLELAVLGAAGVVPVAVLAPVPVPPLPPPPQAVSTATAALMSVKEKGEKRDVMETSSGG